MPKKIPLHTVCKNAIPNAKNRRHSENNALFIHYAQSGTVSSQGQLLLASTNPNLLLVKNHAIGLSKYNLLM